MAQHVYPYNRSTGIGNWKHLCNLLAGSDHLFHTDPASKSEPAEVEETPSDSVSFSFDNAVQKYLTHGTEGAIAGGKYGGLGGAPIGLVGGLIYGASSSITGNDLLDVVVGGAIGTVVGSVAMGITGAAILGTYAGLTGENQAAKQ